MNTFKYNIGYALSGGFIKGFAHLGIMQALHEHGITPNILSGVSAGALAAVFYADGREPYHIIELLNTIHLPNSQPFPLTNKDC